MSLTSRLLAQSMPYTVPGYVFVHQSALTNTDIAKVFLLPGDTFDRQAVLDGKLVFVFNKEGLSKEPSPIMEPANIASHVDGREQSR